MRKTFYYLQNHPFHTTFFLGDLFDGGRVISDSEFQQSILRFHWIFQKRSQNLHFHYVSGNHDIGFREVPFQEVLIKRFEKNFEPINNVITVAQTDWIILSTMTLESDSKSVIAYERTKNFVKQLKNQNHFPRILLSHVPLWRPANTHCGPLHQRSLANFSIIQTLGPSHINMLSKNVTGVILEHISPIHIFSGNDHDVCEWTHNFKSQQGVLQAREQTLGSFSWTHSFGAPYVALVSIFESTLEINLCPLPNQTSILSLYFFTAAFSLVVLFYNSQLTFSSHDSVLILFFFQLFFLILLILTFFLLIAFSWL